MKGIAIFLLLCGSALAGDFQAARLLDVAPYKEANNVVPVAVYDRFTLTVEIEGVAYSASYYSSRHVKSADFLVGDQIQAKLSGQDLIVKAPTGKELKGKISRRERLTSPAASPQSASR